MNDRMQRAIARAIAGGPVRRRRPNPVVALYRWRYEIGALALAGLWVRLGVGAGWLLATFPAVAVLLVLAVWPAARRFVAGRYWSVVVQHRLRTGFHETGLTGLSGRLPTILWAAPRGAVIRVLVALPAGVDVAAVVAERAALAVAAFAADVRVEQHPRFANVLRLDVALRRSGAVPGPAGP